MRKFKFRAWEKHLKEIIPVQDISFEKKMINVKSAWRLFDEIELMQYTGLKTNGKEIYEGDIVRIFDETKSVNAAVVFEDGCFCVIGYIGDLRSYPIKHYLSRGYMLEILGNIYENPELLEGVKND